MNLKVILVAIVLVGIAFAAIAIKMFLVKGGEFKKTCGSVDPKTGKPTSCTCHSDDIDDCNNINKEIDSNKQL